MDSTYTDALRDHGQTLITHIGLVDSVGTELASASYARQAVTWVDDTGSQMRPSGDLVFNCTSGDEVAAWHGFDASTAGTDYGGANFSGGPYNFGNDGTFTLDAATTAVDHNNV